MSKSVCLYFKPIRQEYDYNGNLDLKVKDYIIIKTKYGEHLARVMSVSNIKTNIPVINILKGDIIKKVEGKELQNLLKYEEEEKKAKENISEYIKDFELKMQVVSVKYSIDKKHLIIFFTSDALVDFRELLYHMARDYPQKIRLENIGDTRKGAIYYDEYGICGRKFCCSFFPIECGKKAQIKNQNLAPNPINHFGGCGNIRCCLNFEDETYTEIRKTLPKKGDKVKYENEQYVVVDHNVLLKKVVLEKQTKDGKVRITVSLSDLKK